ncbi:MAG: hypothetical protein Q9164_007858, partial [Protoblastenia rupestris]
KLMLNHPFQGGNKRTSLLTTGAFLRVNGYQNEAQGTWTEGERNGTTKPEDAIVRTMTKRLSVEMLKEYFEGISEGVER